MALMSPERLVVEVVGDIDRECVLFIGTLFSNLSTAVDTPAGAA